MALVGAACLFTLEAEARSGLETLRISPLRIMCFTTPCPPWNAMAISQGVEAPGPNPLYLGPLPALSGAKAAVRRVTNAWRRKDCVIIRGKLDGPRKHPRLFVSSVLRSC